MGRATEEKLSELHGLVAEQMAEKVKNGDYTAAELATIVKFLKDNGINTDGQSDETVQKISADLPDDIDGVVPMYGGSG